MSDKKKSLFGTLLKGILGGKKDEKDSKKTTTHSKKSQEDLKKEEAAAKEAARAAAEAEARKRAEEERRKEELRKKEEEEKRLAEDDNEDGDDSDDGDDNKPSRFGDKFKKDGVKKPKTLKEIADESKKKQEEMEGKAFAEGDAAQKDLKKAETGYEKIIKKKTKKALEGKVFLIRGKDNGKPAWHYVLVSPEKIQQLKKQKSGTNIDVTDFGKIIKSGWGEDPSDEIVKEIEEEYGD